LSALLELNAGLASAELKPLLLGLAGLSRHAVTLAVDELPGVLASGEVSSLQTPRRLVEEEEKRLNYISGRRVNELAMTFLNELNTPFLEALTGETIDWLACSNESSEPSESLPGASLMNVEAKACSRR